MAQHDEQLQQKLATITMHLDRMLHILNSFDRVKCQINLAMAGWAAKQVMEQMQKHAKPR